MNWEAWKPLATLIFTSTLKFVGGLLVAHGLATNGPGLEALGGAATTAAGAFWSWWVQKGHIQAGDYLKKLTDTATQAAAIEVAKRMPLASVTGAAAPAKAEAKAIEPAVMAKDAAKIASLILLALLWALAFPGGAHAQPQKFSTNGMPCDLAGLLPGCKKLAANSSAGAAASNPLDVLSKLMTDIENVKSEIITGAIGALNEADADAATLTNPSDATSFHDPISHACYPAQIKFLQSLPAYAAIQAPSPYNLIVLFQRKRDFVMLIQAGLPGYLKVGCAALLGDEATILVKSLGIVGITVAANAILPGAGGLALPALPALAL